jgi:hypothetical protein
MMERMEDCSRKCENMKKSRFLIIIAVAAAISFLMPAIASANGHGHGRFGIAIGIGLPIYGGYGYWPGPCYYPYYPYPGPVYFAPPYYPPVVARPSAETIAAAREAAITSYVNVPNSNGSITPVRIRRIGTVWVGPKGEQYLSYPTVEQLKPVYGF